MATSQQSEEPVNKTADECNFNAGKYLVVVDGTLICAKSDGIYLKDDVIPKGRKQLSKKMFTPLCLTVKQYIKERLYANPVAAVQMAEQKKPKEELYDTDVF